MKRLNKSTKEKMNIVVNLTSLLTILFVIAIAANNTVIMSFSIIITAAIWVGVAETIRVEKKQKTIKK